MSAIAPAPAPAPARLESGMTHREVLEALSGLLLGMFVAILSSTVVSTALPEIIADLGGSQSSYTWVVTSTLLALTVSTPVWGKLADLFDRKLLVQTGLAIYVGGSLLAGLSQSTSMLIGFRVVQGIGVGGLTALVQVILADLVSPRERGRYAGYLGAVFGVGTVIGPLLGGVVTDAFGWRWCFYIGVPFAIAAFVVLQRTLHLPRHPRRDVSIDYLGGGMIAGGIASLLIWVSLAGQQFAWGSWQTALLVALGAALAAMSLFRAGEVPERGRWRPLVFVTLSCLAFALLLHPLGLVPTMLVSILLACFAGGHIRPIPFVLLCLVLVVAIVGIFVLALRIQIPLWPPH